MWNKNKPKAKRKKPNIPTIRFVGGVSSGQKDTYSKRLKEKLHFLSDTTKDSWPDTIYVVAADKKFQTRESLASMAAPTKL